VRLAGRVIASHYAEAAERKLVAKAIVRDAPSDEAQVIREVQPGEPFWLLDDSVGWAWGYAGKERLVGYVRSGAVGTS
jgi:hypothetical protein